MENFKNILFVFPVMLYYLLEAAIVAVFITIMTKLFLSNMVGSVSYLEWLAIYWIVKMLFFDVFKLVTGLNLGKNIREQEFDNKEEITE